MIYSKENCESISFPLGGIGSGCIGLSGNGSLVDWEIFNRPAKNTRNGISHFAVRTEEAGQVTALRILNGDLMPPYSGFFPEKGVCSGFGFGVSENSLAGWPHFPDHEFHGQYPVATVHFKDDQFPLQCNLTAWSVLIPGESRDSSLPAAFFEINLANPTARPLDCTVIGVLANPWGYDNTCRYNRIVRNQLTAYSGDDIGDVTLTLDEPLETLSWQTCFFRGAWRDYQEMYYNDLMCGGRFHDRCYSEPPAAPEWEHGLLATHFQLAPGERRTTRFILSWSIPVYEKYWQNPCDTRVADAGLKTHWRNYYATVWRDSRDSGAYACREFDRLRQGTFAFRDALFSGNLPEVIKDAVSSSLSVLKSPTCLRLEDGTFYGWEGVASTFGSCEGSCTHVWNYAQALPFLFPDLEQSMRESHLKYSVDESGGSHFRLQLPLGIQAHREDFRPCADGQFGDVMKLYRDWKISGDSMMIRRWWPTIRKTIEYAWSPENPDCWDPEQTGVLQGRQHHTLDMELFGPNAWLTGHYLGALDAAARMADFVGDGKFAARCRTIRQRGLRWVDENLFNGEYFCQKLQLNSEDIIRKFGAESYWNAEAGEIKYQIADGCSIDATLAQNYASLYGLDRIFDAGKQRSTLRSIYHYNFKHIMRNHVNFWRIFSLNDESGVQICTWPHGNKPAVPLTYHTETMTGFEWAFASQLAEEGMVEEALEVAAAIRYRFDGRRRNPWNEFECGSNYARSMAAYGMLPALSGFRYDRGAGMLGFAPKWPEFSGFWAIGELWGVFSLQGSRARLELRHGEFLLQRLEFTQTITALRHNGNTVTLPILLHPSDVLEIDLAGTNKLME